MSIIIGINPVSEAIKEKKRPIECVYLHDKSLKNDKIQSIIRLCKKNKIPYKIVDKKRLDRLSKTTKHQNVLAIIGEIRYSPLDKAFSYNRVLFLDRVTDCGNLGAIIRSAAFFNWNFIVMPQKESAPVNKQVAKSSAGAIEYVNIAKIKSPLQAVREFKKKGFFVISAESCGEDIKEFHFHDEKKQKILLIMGGEDKGVRETLKRESHAILKISGNEKTVNSLNVSVASAIMMYEVNKKTNGV